MFENYDDFLEVAERLLENNEEVTIEIDDAEEIPQTELFQALRRIHNDLEGCAHLSFFYCSDPNCSKLHGIIGIFPFEEEENDG